MAIFKQRGEIQMSIPNDPAILLSYINTLLRDKYDDLDKLCDDMQLDSSAITAKLGMIGYSYDEKQNRFR